MIVGGSLPQGKSLLEAYADGTVIQSALDIKK